MLYRLFRTEILPGFFLSALIGLAGIHLAQMQDRLLGNTYLDALVVAILLGTILNSLFGLPRRLVCGIAFSSKFVLEFAVALLGASISLQTLMDAGVIILVCVVVIVFVSLLFSYKICRFLGLSQNMSVLVACGNSICGNSAISAVAPVIGARSDEITASIAFTAAFGIIVVLCLPVCFTLLHLSEWQYGLLAGMTVYAVPQVIAATVPIGTVSLQIGTIVKLTRVLMLGPVIILVGMLGNDGGSRPTTAKMLPWFVVAFFALIGMRSIGLVPDASAQWLKSTSTTLTIVSMAALGLSVNMRTVFASGGKVLLAGCASILILALLTTVALFLTHLH